LLLRRGIFEYWSTQVSAAEQLSARFRLLPGVRAIPSDCKCENSLIYVVRGMAAQSDEAAEGYIEYVGASLQDIAGSFLY
jgi:hypothetical protein